MNANDTWQRLKISETMSHITWLRDIMFKYKSTGMGNRILQI